jgi:S1-C subfamily serine protease
MPRKSLISEREGVSHPRSIARFRATESGVTAKLVAGDSFRFARHPPTMKGDDQSRTAQGSYLAVWRMRSSWLSSILFSEFRKGVLLDMANSILETIASEFASAAEKVGSSVVAVHARRWLPTSGIEWKKGVIVTVHHGVQRDEDIKVLLAGGRMVSAKLAGRDPSTDIAVLTIEETSSGAAQLGDSTSLRLGHVVLALGRTRRGDVVASSGIVGGISGEWRSRRGGQINQHIRLDLALYPGFSGGPLVNARSEVVGMNTRGLARGRAVTVPMATVNRVVEELLKKGHIARPYLGIATQSAELPQSVRAKLPTEARAGLLVVHVENSGPAEKAGVLLGDVLFEVSGKMVEDVDALQDSLATAKVGDVLQVRIIRAGEIKPVSITLGERTR